MNRGKKALFRKAAAMVICAVMLFITAPEVYAKGAEKVWKVVYNAHTVFDELYGLSEDGIFYGGKGRDYAFYNTNFQPVEPVEGVEYPKKPDYTIVKKDGKFGVTNADGALFIPIKYDWIWVDNGYFNAILDNKHGILDSDGKVVIPIEYEAVSYGDNDNFIVMQAEHGINEYGVMNIKGDIIIPLKYGYIEASGYGDSVCFIVQRDSKYGIINLTEDTIIPFEYEYIRGAGFGSKDWFIVWQDHKCGVINMTGDTIIPLKYENIWPREEASYDESDGFIVSITNQHGNSKCGVIDTSGREIIPIEFDSIIDVKDGYYIVATLDENYNYREGVYDSTGKKIISEKYEGIVYVGKGVFKAGIYTYTNTGESNYTTYVIDKDENIIYKGERASVFPLGTFVPNPDNGGDLIYSDTALVYYAPDLEAKKVSITQKGNLYRYCNIAEGSLSKLAAGSKVIHISDTGTGWSVVLSGSYIGYVKNSILDMKNLSGYGTIAMTSAAELHSNMKFSANTKIGSIPKGAKVTVVSILDEWLQVKYKGKDGYILRNNTEQQYPESETDEIIVWKDSNFEKRIREIIDKPSGDIYKSEVAGMTELYLESSNIKVIDDIVYFPNLTYLDLNVNQISDISALGELTNLTGLELYGNQISDISALEKLVNLTYLDLDENQIYDINALKKLTNLTSLRLDSNQISDISVLEKLTNLTALWVEYNQVSDVSALGKLTNLTKLGLSGNQISDISALGKLTNLTILWLGGNQISDINALGKLTNLTELGLGANQITDISALGKLTNLIYLMLGANQISDINALGKLINLIGLSLDYNQISDISALRKLTNLTELGLDENQITDWSPVSHIKSVGGRP